MRHSKRDRAEVDQMNKVIIEALTERVEALERRAALSDANQQEIARAISVVDVAVGGSTGMLRDCYRALLRAGLLSPALEPAPKPAREKVLN